MPKLKTHRGAKKRFKVTGSGKVKVKNAGSRHILTKKTRKSKRQKAVVTLTDADSQNVKKLLPYG